jgi:glycine cleavage system protein P-like pyridoxal-binding family
MNELNEGVWIKETPEREDAIEPTETRVKRTLKSFLDMFEEATTDIVGLRFEGPMLVGLNEEWPEHYIKLSVAHRPNGKQTREEEKEKEKGNE